MADSLRVLMTADTVGGIFSYAVSLAEALTARGARVTLATMGGRMRPDQAGLVRRIPRVTVVESDYALEWSPDPWRDVDRAGAWLLDLEREARPDVVHLNGYCHGALPWRAPAVVVAHSCVLSWWRAVWGEPAPSRYARYAAEVTRGLRAAQAVVAPTATMLAAIHEHYGKPRNDLVIPNGAPIPKAPSGPREPCVLAAGRIWDEAKNLRTLARVAPRLRAPIYVAGSDHHPDGSYRTLPSVRSLGLLSAEALHEWMSRAAVFALPARYEPFGLAALEAAARGAALVLGDIPSLREVWSDAAILVPPDDDAALGSALERLLSDEPLRHDLALRARRRASTFHVRHQADHYFTLYRSLIHDDSRSQSERPCA